MIDEIHSRSLSSSTISYDGIVLDSGCGTGKSTKLLASKIHPRHLVIGVDRSLARLTKTKDNRLRGGDDSDGDNERNKKHKKKKGDANHDDDAASEREAYCHQVSDNAFLVRAELVDFWRCCIEHGWAPSFTGSIGSSVDGNEKDKPLCDDGESLKITHHYMLYPNPYPTNARLSSRWYAHPSFPLILKLGIETMVLRSNWEGYLSEFATAIEMADAFYAGSSGTGDNEEGSHAVADNGGSTASRNLALPYVDSAKKGPVERTDKSVSFTNFESKYDNVGERTYELIVKRKNQ